MESSFSTVQLVGSILLSASVLRLPVGSGVYACQHSLGPPSVRPTREQIQREGLQQDMAHPSSSVQGLPPCAPSAPSQPSGEVSSEQTGAARQVERADLPPPPAPGGEGYRSAPPPGTGL